MPTKDNFLKDELLKQAEQVRRSYDKIENALSAQQYSQDKIDRVIAYRWHKGGRQGKSIWGFPLKEVLEQIDKGITCTDEILLAYRAWLQEDHLKRLNDLPSLTINK